MDSASDFESEGCGFDPHPRCFLIIICEMEHRSIEVINTLQTSSNGLVGYDGRLTRDRSRVRSSVRVYFLSRYNFGFQISTVHWWIVCFVPVGALI